MFDYSAAEVRKFITAGLGAVASVATQLLALGDVVPPEVANWLTVIVSVCTALGVFGVPNKQPAPVDVATVDDPPTIPLELPEHDVRSAPRRKPVI